MEIGDDVKVAQVYSKFLVEPWAIDLFRALPKSAKYAAGLSFGDQPIDVDQQLLTHGLEQLRSKSLSGSRIAKLRYRIAKTIGGGEISRLEPRFRNAGIRLIHAHFADTAYTFLPLAKRLEIPLVFSFYGWDYAKLPLKQPAYLNHFKKLFDYASAVIAEGPYGALTIRELGCPSEKVKVVPLGLPVSAFAKTRHTKRLKTILQAAAFTEKKAQHITLSAFEQIASEIPEATLTFIAPQRDGEYEARIRERCDASPFANRIQILPAVPYEVLAKVFSSYTIFCQPSIHAQDGDSEGGAPVSILIAQAQGLAVVGSKHCDIPFVTAPLAWNALADEGNIHQLARALKGGLERDEHSFASDASYVEAWTNERFSIEDSGKRLMQLYRSVVE